jgi:3-oxoadipate enol-lactonase
MPFATSQGCRIYYRLEGPVQKPLLVLVHALGTDHGMWDPQMASLLRYFQVLRLDLRGHGASGAPAGEYTIGQLADDVLATVRRERFSYCGLSLGGMIGQWLGAHHAERLERLVLANTSPRVADPDLFEARRKTVLEEGLAAVEPGVMARFFSSLGQPGADSIRTVLLATDPAGYAGCCAAIRDMDHRALLPGITVPTLVIGGDADLSTPWSGQGEILASQIPRRLYKENPRGASVQSRTSVDLHSGPSRVPSPGPATRSARGRFCRASRRARRHARRSLHREHQRLHPRVSGSDHTLCLGHDLDTSMSRPASPAIACAGHDSVDRTMGRVPFARADRPRRGTRTGRPQGGATAGSGLRRRACRELRVPNRGGGTLSVTSPAAPAILTASAPRPASESGS